MVDDVITTAAGNGYSATFANHTFMPFPPQDFGAAAHDHQDGLFNKHAGKFEVIALDDPRGSADTLPHVDESFHVCSGSAGAAVRCGY